MRVPLKSRSSGSRNSLPDVSNEIGSRASGPAMTDRSSARSGTFLAIGPMTASVSQARSAKRGTRPGDGRRPTTLQKLGGFRSEPPRSVPSAKGSIPQAVATAAPPLLPPHVRLRS